MSDNPASPRILAVDDEPRNLLILEGLLAPAGYELRQAACGEEALDQVSADPPDLILLDVMMPGISGFDVCRRLKQDPKTRPIPVVLVTALADKESRIRGIESGADDFISKPVDGNELRARVKSLLRVKSFYDELQLRYEELRRLEAMRETLTQMIVHDLRNPLASVWGYVQLLEDVVQEPPDARQYLRAVYKSTQILMDMITAMLDLAKLEAGEMVLNVGPVSLHEVAGEVEEGMRSLLETKGLKLSMEISDDLPLLSADRESLRRILMNILSNAIAYSPKEGRIALAAHAGDGEVRAEMRDEGPGIPPEYREKIFEKFGQVESRQSGRKYSTGLGLTYCKMAVESQGGRIGVESEVGKGSTFWIVLPVAT